MVPLLYIAIGTGLILFTKSWYDDNNKILKSKSIKRYYIKNNPRYKDFNESTEYIISRQTIWPRIEFIRENQLSKADFTIEIVERDFLEKYADKKSDVRFSYTVFKPGKIPCIYIDAINWCKGVERSKLNLNGNDGYRRYVILHEVGHALGYDHSKCDKKNSIDGKCSIMYPITKGAPDGTTGVYFGEQSSHLQKY